MSLIRIKKKGLYVIFVRKYRREYVWKMFVQISSYRLTIVIINTITVRRFSAANINSRERINECRRLKQITTYIGNYCRPSGDENKLLR